MCGILCNPRALALKDREIATLEQAIRKLEADQVILRRRNKRLEEETLQAKHAKDVVRRNEELRLTEIDKRTGALDAKEYEIQELKAAARADQKMIRDQKSTLEVYEFQIKDGQRLLAEAETEHQELEAKLEEAREQIEQRDRVYEAALDEQNALKQTIAEREDILRRQDGRLNALEPVRWDPLPEVEVKNDLVSLNASIRSWTRDTATTGVAPWIGMSDADLAKLFNYMCLIGIYPQSLPDELANSETGPALFLNALLAHDIYTKVLAAPFSSINDTEQGPSSMANFYDTLTYYKTSQTASGSRFMPDRSSRSQRSIDSEKELHMWRSQTLRMLTPSSSDPTHEEIDLLQSRDDRMRDIAKARALSFLAGFNLVFIEFFTTQEETITCQENLEAIYFQAAQVAYNLWTRRQTFKVTTLADMGPVTFDADNALMEPHPSVRVDDHQRRLKGRPVTLIMHPLLEVIGTEEGEGFDQEPRVLMPAEVWLDSSLPGAARKRQPKPAPKPLPPDPTKTNQQPTPPPTPPLPPKTHPANPTGHPPGGPSGVGRGPPAPTLPAPENLKIVHFQTEEDTDTEEL